MRLTESDCDALDLIERNLIARAVVELGRARAFMRGHGLRIFERAAGLEIDGDAGCAEHVVAKLLLEPGFRGTAADHAAGIDAVHRLAGEHAGSAARDAEEGTLPSSRMPAAATYLSRKA